MMSTQDSGFRTNFLLFLNVNPRGSNLSLLGLAQRQGVAAERAGPRPPWPAQPCPFLSQVELATGQFPYKNCKTDFEVLTKVLQEEPPLLPGHMGFSGDFQSFVKDW